MLEDLVKNRVDSKKPRAEGLTFIIDKFQSIDKESFEILSPFVDTVKIYGALPLLVPEMVLKKRIKFYHDFDVRVSTGSTIAEFAILENSITSLAKNATELGFDTLELGENNVDLLPEDKKKIVDTIASQDLDFQWKVGKKDPRHQLSIEETLTKIDQAMVLGSKKIVLEANEGLGVGVYDEKGSVKWNFVGALTARYSPNTFVFEAPLESQQSALIAEFGQRVNLAEIRSDAITSIESQRRGFLSKSVFGVSHLRKDPEGGPAAKFMYYIIKTKYPIDQSELANISHLPRRTVQAAIEELKKQGLIIERNSLDDARKKMYHPMHSDWI